MTKKLRPYFPCCGIYRKSCKLFIVQSEGERGERESEGPDLENSQSTVVRDDYVVAEKVIGALKYEGVFPAKRQDGKFYQARDEGWLEFIKAAVLF